MGPQRNADRMIVKNREGTERQVSEKSGPFMKKKKYLFRQGCGWAGLQQAGPHSLAGVLFLPRKYSVKCPITQAYAKRLHLIQVLNP